MSLSPSRLEKRRQESIERWTKYGGKFVGITGSRVTKDEDRRFCLWGDNHIRFNRASRRVSVNWYDDAYLVKNFERLEEFDRFHFIYSTKYAINLDELVQTWGFKYE